MDNTTSAHHHHNNNNNNTNTNTSNQPLTSIVDDDSNALTDYEAALYDRGIRVWGVDAQNRLRRSRVLVVGLAGLNSELVKNIALAGVGQINIIDHHIVAQHDIGLFITPESVGKSRAEASLASIAELNPLIHVRADTIALDAIDNEYVKSFTLVCVDTLDSALELRLNVLCRMNNIPFILTHSFGMQAYFFSDLGDRFKYSIKKKVKVPVARNNGSSNGQHTTITSTTEPKMEEREELVEQVSSFASLNDALSTQWNHLPNRVSTLYFALALLYQFQQSHNRLPTAANDSDSKELLRMLEDNNKKYNITPTNKNADIVASALKHMHTEIAPVCAIVGGIVGQEIVKVICRDNEVMNNFFFYDALKDSGIVEPIRPK